MSQTQPDKRLPNGALELDRRPHPSGDGSFIVLAKVSSENNPFGDEWATWREFDGVTQWGHYFHTYTDKDAEQTARRDFETRP